MPAHRCMVETWTIKRSKFDRNTLNKHMHTCCIADFRCFYENYTYFLYKNYEIRVNLIKYRV